MNKMVANKKKLSKIFGDIVSAKSFVENLLNVARTAFLILTTVSEYL